MKETSLRDKERSNFLGLWLAVIKIAPKIIPIVSKFIKVLPKLLKGATGIKAAGAVGSLGLYTYLFSWQMGVALVVFLLIHEYGHLWAMKKCGLKTRGMYLIPGLGAVALMGERFKTSRDEAFIAIMGPLFGLFFLVPITVVYLSTNNPMYIAIASIMSLINLFNLFPINPLDGGRITKALLYSVHKSFGLFFMFISMAMAIYIAYYFKLGLVAYIAAIGLFEMISDYGLADKLKNFKKTIIRGLAGVLMYYPGKHMLLNAHASLFTDVVSILLLIATTAFFVWDMRKSTQKEGLIFLAYPYIVVKNTLSSIREMISLRPSDLKHTIGYKKMNGKQIALYAVLYIVTAALMIACIVYASHVPGAHHAEEILR